MKDIDTQINLELTCRVCLTEEKNMKSLFSVEQILENEIQLSDILMSCSSITIEKDEGLPEKICYKCSEQANISYLFRKLCESSDTTLRELSKQYEIQREIFTEEHQEIDIPKEISSEQHILCTNNGNNELESSFGRHICESQDLDRSISIDEESKENFGQQKKLQIEECKVTNNLSYKNDSFICNCCSERFSEKTSLLLHIKSNHNNIKKKTGILRKKKLPTTCDICNKTFRFHSNLVRHKLVHSKEKPYLCNVCGIGFAQMSALKIHTFIHTGEKPYKCQICTQSFSSPGTLSTHLRTHTGERPYVCKICDKKFPQAGYLTSHIRTHTGERHVECKICRQRFNQSGRLTIHMRKHSGEKPYQCNVCTRSFAVKHTLKKHMRTHTGERPYSCRICSRSFAQNGTLATHMKIHRPKLNE